MWPRLRRLLPLVSLSDSRGRRPRSQSTAYEGARLIVGDGRVIENATVVVEGARIAQVGPATDVRVPAGARRVSLAGKTVMPMIVDTHTHLSTTRDGLMRDLKQRALFREDVSDRPEPPA